MKTLHLWFLLVLALPLVWTADEKCVCTFPSQMAGRVRFYLQRQGSIVWRNYFNFQMDNEEQVGKWKEYSENGKVHFLDFGDMTVYTYNSSAFINIPSPNCTSAPLPDWMKTPGCVPPGLDVKNNKTSLGEDSTDYDTYTNNNESEFYIYPDFKYLVYEVKRNTDPCQPTYIADTIKINSTLNRSYELLITSYVWNRKETYLLPPNIDQCIPGNFADSRLFQG